MPFHATRQQMAPLERYSHAALSEEPFMLVESGSGSMSILEKCICHQVPQRDIDTLTRLAIESLKDIEGALKYAAV